MELKKAVDNLLFYDPEFEGFASKFVSELGGSSAIQSITNMDELKNAINSFTNVKFLEICFHGSPGFFYLADKCQVVGAYLGELAQGKPFIQKNARILFDSCSIGQGEAGDRFMDELGKKMLTGKGGVIGASTAENVRFKLIPFCNGLYFEEFSDGRLKVKRYDVNGKQVGALAVDRYGKRY